MTQSSVCGSRPARHVLPQFSTPFSSSLKASSISSTITNQLIFSSRRPLGRLIELSDLHFALIRLDHLTGEPFSPAQRRMSGRTILNNQRQSPCFIINDAGKSVKISFNSNSSSLRYLVSVVCVCWDVRTSMFLHKHRSQ